MEKIDEKCEKPENRKNDPKMAEGPDCFYRRVILIAKEKKRLDIYYIILSVNLAAKFL